MKTSVKGFMFYVAFVASLGGLLFGFDTAVISGAEKAIQGIYALSDFAHGFTIATALIGTIVGALVCGGPAERYGRLRSLKVIAWLYLISAVGSAVIVNWYSFMFFRFLGGLAVGASSVVGPMYIAEISPSHWRGRFVAFFQFNIVLGIVIAYLTNYWIVGIPHDWQWMLGIEAVPALAFGLLLMTVPESPRWLLIRSRGAVYSNAPRARMSKPKWPRSAPRSPGRAIRASGFSGKNISSPSCWRSSSRRSTSSRGSTPSSTMRRACSRCRASSARGR